MPTTITSAGVTFTDTTTLTSANIGTAQLVNGSVIAAKLGTNEQKQIAKAWVNFDGTLATPITPRANYNISSVTKNSTATYTVNFTTALADANYAVAGMAGEGSSTNRFIAGWFDIPTTTSFRVRTIDATMTADDSAYVSVIIFGN